MLSTFDLSHNLIKREEALLPVLQMSALRTLLLYHNPFLRHGAASDDFHEVLQAQRGVDVVTVPPAEPQPPGKMDLSAMTTVSEPPSRRATAMAIAKAKQQKALQEKAAQEQADKAAKVAKAEKAAREKAEKAERDKAAQEKQAREAAQRKREEAAEEKRLAQQREENLKRMMGQIPAGSGAPGSRGTAAVDAAPSRSYAGLIVKAVKPNIVFTDVVSGNPEAVIEVRAAPTGTIIGRRLVKSSGSREWDEAVLRAIDRTGSLPKDTDGRVPGTVEIVFRPKD
jgi:colicin import membrane protein